MAGPGPDERHPVRGAGEVAHAIGGQGAGKIRDLADNSTRRGPLVADDGLDDAWLGPDGADGLDGLDGLVLKTNREIEPGADAPPGPTRSRQLTSWSVASAVHRSHPTAEVRLVDDVLAAMASPTSAARLSGWLPSPG